MVNFMTDTFQLTYFIGTRWPQKCTLVGSSGKYTTKRAFYKMKYFWISNLFQARSSIKCGVSLLRFFTYINKEFFTHVGQFSKCLSDFKNSYLRQITLNELTPTHWNLSFLIGNPKAFHFDNLSFVVHFTVEHTGVLFGSPGIESNNDPFVNDLFIRRT